MRCAKGIVQENGLKVGKPKVHKAGLYGRLPASPALPIIVDFSEPFN
jgi:hypothetical protein